MGGSGGKVPCVKGTLFLGTVRGVHKLLKAGLVSREEIEARLEPGDLEILDDKVVPVLWYPVDTMGRLLELIWETAGGERREFLVELGRRSCDELIAGGTYSALSACRDEWGDRVLKVMTGTSRSFYNFMEWDVVDLDERRSELRVTGAAAWPDPLIPITEGFILRLADHPEVSVTGARTAPDTVVFRVEGRDRFG